MVLDIIKYIGEQVKGKNAIIDTFAVNCIKLKDGQVVNFVGHEKQNFGISDIRGTSFYIRMVDPKITYTRSKAMASNLYSYDAGIKFRVVFFQIGALDMVEAAYIENKISGDIRKITFAGYGGKERRIKVINTGSTLDYSTAFFEEVGKDFFTGQPSVIVALDYQLTWNFVADTCPDECITLTYSEGCSTPAPKPTYLTCNTLKDCQTIKDMQAAIEALEEGGGGIDCEELAQCQVIKDLQDFDTQIQLAVDALGTAITQEANTRANADTALQTNINTEASTRASADAALQTSIDGKWDKNGNALVGGEKLGSTNNQPVDIYINDVRRARFLVGGIFLWNSTVQPTVVGNVAHHLTGGRTVIGDGDENGYLLIARYHPATPYSYIAACQTKDSFGTAGFRLQTANAGTPIEKNTWEADGTYKNDVNIQITSQTALRMTAFDSNKNLVSTDVTIPQANAAIKLFLFNNFA